MSLPCEDLCGCGCCQDWRPRWEEAQRKIGELSERLNYYQGWDERRRKYDHKSNQELSAKAARFAVYLDRLAEQWKAEGREGPQQVNAKAMSLELGFGEAAGYSALDELEAAGHLRQSKGEPFTITTAKGKKVTIEPICVEVLDRDPDEIGRQRNHGGNRCPHCGSEAGAVERRTTEVQTIRRTTRKTGRYCKGCGARLAVTTHTHEEPLTPPTIREEKAANPPNPSDLQFEGRIAETAEVRPSDPQLEDIDNTGGDSPSLCVDPPATGGSEKKEPVWLEPIPGNYPQELVGLTRWVNGRAEWREGKAGKPGKWTKPPVDPKTGEYADVRKRATWGTVYDAIEGRKRYGLPFMGIVLTDDDDLCGYDIDDCVDPATGEIDAEAWQDISEARSYTEYSPSGTGVRIFLRGELPQEGRRAGRYEMYGSGRWLTVTGRRVPGTPATVRRCSDTIRSIHARRIAGQCARSALGRSSLLTVSDEELCARISRGRSGAKFERLMRADWSDYPSPSEAFFGLLGMLTCRTHDVDQIERVVRRSGLEAEKWDQPRGDSTWLRRDVEKNLANALRVAPGSDA